MGAIYEVQTIDRESGTEHWVRVEAAGREEARTRVESLGELVREVRLIEVRRDEGAALPGMVGCPKCGSTEWHGGRGVLLWIGVVLLFPIGLLLLFIRPTWRCAACGYSFQSYQTPVTGGRDKPTAGFHGFEVVLVAAALVVGMLVLAMLLSNGVSDEWSPGDPLPDNVAAAHPPSPAAKPEPMPTHTPAKRAKK